MATTAQQLLDAARLADAVKAQTEEVRAHPTDVERRYVLFALLCVLLLWPLVIAQVGVLVASLPNYIARVGEALRDAIGRLEEAVGPDYLDARLRELAVNQVAGMLAFLGTQATRLLGGGFAIFSVFVNLIYFRRIVPPGIPTLIMAVFFFSGLQLFFFGVLGEYIAAIHFQVRKRPLVIEKELINFDRPPGSNGLAAGSPHTHSGAAV